MISVPVHGKAAARLDDLAVFFNVSWTATIALPFLQIPVEGSQASIDKLLIPGTPTFLQTVSGFSSATCSRFHSTPDVCSSPLVAPELAGIVEEHAGIARR